MKTLLCLLLTLSAECFEISAQTPVRGPWRVVYKQVPGYAAADWGDSTGSTATGWRTKTEAVLAAWDVPPDSIRFFLNCENPLIAPPKPSAGQKPVRFTATGASLRLDEKQGMLWVAPFTPEVTLCAYRGSRLIFRHKFAVASPPLPEIRCFDSAGPAGCQGLIGRQKRAHWVYLRAVPNRDFHNFSLADARYRISQSRAVLIREREEIFSAAIAANSQFDLTEIERLAQPRDQLKVEVLLVERMNFCGDVEKVSVQKTLTIPLLTQE